MDRYVGSRDEVVKLKVITNPSLFQGTDFPKPIEDKGLSDTIIKSKSEKATDYIGSSDVTDDNTEHVVYIDVDPMHMKTLQELEKTKQLLEAAQRRIKTLQLENVKLKNAKRRKVTKPSVDNEMCELSPALLETAVQWKVAVGETGYKRMQNSLPYPLPDYSQICSHLQKRRKIQHDSDSCSDCDLFD